MPRRWAMQAHSIKGAAASLGVQQLATLAETMEKAGRSGDLDGAVMLVPSLEAMVSEPDNMQIAAARLVAVVDSVLEGRCEV